MNLKKRLIIILAVLLIIAAGVFSYRFFYLRVPGTAIRGLADVSPTESSVTIHHTEITWSDTYSLERTHTTHYLNAEQIELLIELIQESRFIRVPDRTRTFSLADVDSTHNFDIAFNDVPGRPLYPIGIRAAARGYFNISVGADHQHLTLRIINYSDWEEMMLQILVMTPEGDKIEFGNVSSHPLFSADS